MTMLSNAPKRSFGADVKKLFKIDKPFAITMWEFSWIERRWPGAGYEDWDKALDELTERGYDSVRIDAFPHLMAKDAFKEWTLNPVWNVQDWGSRSITRITLHDDLRDFLKACRRHGVRVALSTWFREDVDKTCMEIITPEDHANIWIKTLDYIKSWGELDNILYVDLCNEFPLSVWAPFFTRGEDVPRDSKKSSDWMRRAVSRFKEKYPDIPVTFSYTAPYPDINEDVSFLDFIEAHVWMTAFSDFYQKVGYNFERFSDTGYTNMALYGEKLYREEKERFDRALVDGVNYIAEWSVRSGKPLVTTECWSVVDYKDWPLLNWNWILGLNRLGVETAVSAGRWAGMATSNFCGPQFVGMWREKDWHINLTTLIRSGKIE